MRLLLSLLAVATVSLTTGCVVVPARHYARAAEPGPVYVEPAYASPGVGFVWKVHPRLGITHAWDGIAAGAEWAADRPEAWQPGGGGIERALMGQVNFFTDSSGTLIRPDPAVAVKKIMTGPTYCTSTPTDVREDFDLKSSTQVMVPAGAVFLKFSAPDTLFNDNVSQDYRVIVRK